MGAIRYSDYMPRKDDDFNGWQSNFIKYVTANLAPFGISPLNADWVALLGLQTAWNSKFGAGNRFVDRTHSDVVAKQKQRVVYERALRLFYKRYIANNAAVSNTDRAGMGTKLPDTVRTRAAVPKHAPSGFVKHIDHLFHELRIVDAKTPSTKGKPPGVRTTRIYQFIGAQPPDMNTARFEFIGGTSSYEYTARFETADMGKTACYYFQYENTHGETGPASEVISAVIA